MHWAAQYIGTPYSETGEGPESFYCWSFFRHIEKQHFSRELPSIPNEDHLLAVAKSFRDRGERKDWVLTDDPKDGDGVLMRQARYPTHCGVWLDIDGCAGVLHCVRGNGVVFQRMDDLTATGWKVEGVYSYVGGKE